MATNLAYAVQRPGEGTAILNAYRSIALSTTFHRVTGVYAFASLKGVRLFVNALSASPSWAGATKRWVISIDGGITEPTALRFLLNQRRTVVSVPYAEELLARRLQPHHRFHPKTLLLEREGPGFAPAAIVVGSANLTFSGLCVGHEHAMSVQSTAGGLPATVNPGLNELQSVVTWATVIDTAFIDRYTALRPAAPVLPEEFEDPRADLILQDNAVIPPAQAAALAAAKHFWIAIDYVVANRGRHEEGNQIDMQRGSRVYFGFGDRSLPKNSPIGSVRILFGGHTANRNLRFGNNSMDKLDLPIPGVEGPPTYTNQTLLFTRESASVYRLTVGSAADITSWKNASRRAGTLFSMRSGREFGIY